LTHYVQQVSNIQLQQALSIYGQSLQTGERLDSSAMVQRRSPRNLNDILNRRKNEKELDDHEDALDDLVDFTKKDHPEDEKRLSPGEFGSFFVKYKPYIEALFVTVKLDFLFIPGSRQEVDPDDMEKYKAGTLGRAPKMLEIKDPWTAEEQQEWKTKFLIACSAGWSHKHVLHAHRDWWENLKAQVVVTFIEQSKDSTAGNFVVQVHKDPLRSHVRPGSAQFWDVDTRSPIVAVHETGHMMGLGDEYAEGDKTGQSAAHSKLVEAEFGPQKAIIRGKENPDSIMGIGTRILPEHGITFLEAIREIAPETPWHLSPKSPRPVPKEE
jgi:hypothetical protein